jgi:hypothetical protein
MLCSQLNIILPSSSWSCNMTFIKTGFPQCSVFLAPYMLATCTANRSLATRRLETISEHCYQAPLLEATFRSKTIGKIAPLLLRMRDTMIFCTSLWGNHISTIHLNVILSVSQLHFTHKTFQGKFAFIEFVLCVLHFLSIAVSFLHSPDNTGSQSSEFLQSRSSSPRSKNE